MVDYTLPLDQLPDPLPIEPLRKPFAVTITPPGSKSITCRAYVLAALAEGQSRIIRPLRADDTDLLLKALCTLGAEARWVPGEGHEGEDVLIRGVAGRFPRGGSVNLGHGGAPSRFMIAAACLAAEPVVVDGSERMRQRPIAEGVDMLRQLGARIDYVEEKGRLPVRVMPSEHFRGGEMVVGRTATSQFLSAMLLIGAHLPLGLTLKFTEQPTSKSYLHLTADVLFDLGLNIACDEGQPKEPRKVPTARHLAFDYNREQLAESFYRSIQIAPQVVRSISISIQPDASSCIYWWVASALHPKSVIWIPDIGVEYSEPDFQFYTLLYSLGCEPRSESIIEGGDVISVNAIQAETALQPCANCFDFADMPDAAVAFAVLASTFPVSTILTGLHTLRHKETDRIAALANELRKVGCRVETTDDSITIHPIPKERLARCCAFKDAAPEEPSDEGADRKSRDDRSACAPASSSLRSSDSASRSSDAASDPIIIETYNDHRMAMAFAVLGLRVPNIWIKNPAVVSKSYPGFWKDFAKLYE